MPQSPDIETFQRRLAETIAWCAERGAVGNPRDCLRTPALRPAAFDESRSYNPHGLPNSSDWRTVVEALAEERARQLGSTGIDPDRLAEDLAGGRLLAYDPDANLFDGAAEEDSSGFFDVDNIPPWDTWISYVGEDDNPPWREFDSYLISWVPPSLVELADNGICINPEQCILWVEELDAPFIEQLRAAGLLPAR
jgi:hypothetical protein